MKQKYMIIDVRWCHNCNNCLMGCKDEYCELDMSTGPVHSDWSDSDPQPRHGHRWIDVTRRERGVYARNDIAYLPMPLPALRERALHRCRQRGCGPPRGRYCPD